MIGRLALAALMLMSPGLARAAAPAAALPPAGTYAYGLLDDSEAAGPDGGMLFATQPAPSGAEMKLNVVLIYNVPKSDPSVAGPLVSFVVMPLAVSCAAKTERQFAPAVFDGAGNAISVVAPGEWGVSAPVPEPDPGTVEPGFEAYKLACGLRTVNRTFRTIDEAVAYVRSPKPAPH
jgi:hypothetical protein